jgi:uncharacterized protein (TIGR03067 family)
MPQIPLSLFVLLLLSVPSLAAQLGDAADKAVRQERKNLEGTWQLTSLVIDGKERALSKDVVILWILKGSTYTLGLGDEVADRGTWTIEPAAKPGRLDTTSATGDAAKDRPRLGVYELKEDLLKVCTAPAGKDRPGALASAEGTGFELLTFRRLRWEIEREQQSHWVTFLQGPPNVLRLILHLERQDGKVVGGKLDIPDLRQKGLPLGTVENDGRRLTIISPSKSQRFDCDIAPDGRQITGTLKMSGPKEVSQAVTFVRLDTVPDLFSRPQEPKKPFPYREEVVVFENKAAGVKLAGTLTRPKVDGPVPAVVLLSMSGPQDRDETGFGHKPFLVLADYLTRQGIAVLRYDDRGFGKSTGKFLGATTADFAEDARAGVAYLKTRPEIDSKKIGLLGHSEGGVVGPLLASKSPDVAFLVLLGGPAVPGAELALTQTPLFQRLFGATEKQIAFNIAMQKRVIAVLNEEGDDAAAADKIRRAIGEEFAKVSEADRPPLVAMKADFQQQMTPEALPWHRFFLRHDPRPVLARVRCPVLALYGEKDCQVPADPNAREAEKALRSGGNKDGTVKVIAGANHLFQPCRFGSIHEYCAITQTMAPEVLELIATWVRQKTGGQDGRNREERKQG